MGSRIVTWGITSRQYASSGWDIKENFNLSLGTHVLALKTLVDKKNKLDWVKSFF